MPGRRRAGRNPTKTSGTSRARGPGRFSRTEIARAVRAAVEGGAVIERIDLDAGSGRASIIIGKTIK